MKEININQDGFILKEGVDTLILTNNTIVFFNKDLIKIAPCSYNIDFINDLKERGLEELVDDIIKRNAVTKAEEIIKEETSVAKGIENLVDEKIQELKNQITKSIDWCNSASGTEKERRIEKVKDNKKYNEITGKDFFDYIQVFTWDKYDIKLPVEIVSKLNLLEIYVLIDLFSKEFIINKIKKAIKFYFKADRVEFLDKANQFIVDYGLLIDNATYVDLANFISKNYYEKKSLNEISDLVCEKFSK